MHLEMPKKSDLVGVFSSSSSSSSSCCMHSVGHEEHTLVGDGVVVHITLPGVLYVFGNAGRKLAGEKTWQPLNLQTVLYRFL
jgi:hypothetical protein